MCIETPLGEARLAGAIITMIISATTSTETDPDIIKNTVSLPFGRGEDEKAGTFIKLAQSEGFDVDQKAEVHPSTLKAFVKEMVEGGQDFPEELFGAYVGHKATIKR